MLRIALVLATLGALASCTGTPMMGQGLGAGNGVAADAPTMGSAGVDPKSVVDAAKGTATGN